MTALLIKEVRSSKSPWEVYQTVYGLSPVSFFLDSIHYQPPNQTYSYIGFAPFREWIPGANTEFKSLRKLLARHRSRIRKPYFTGGAVGFLGYELAAKFDKIRFRKKPSAGTPPFAFGFYRDLIVYDHRRKKYILVAATKKALSRLEAVLHSHASLSAKGFEFKHFRPETSRQLFERNVRRAKEYIAAGDIYQANLSQRFSFDFKGSALTLYGALRKINPSPFASFLNFHGLHIISSSPERLVRKAGSLASARPIAGTRPKKSSVREFLRNEKERAEHIMLLDLERNDLGRVCEYKSVKVSEMMAIEKYSHVLHIVSEVRGKLRRDKDDLDLIAAMFPGGTITGCPKIRCMEVIDELEPVQRGIYTGSLGYIGFNGDLDLNIVIRTLILQRNRGYFQTGAGIVHDSDPAKEYEETLHKGEALAEALVKASL